MAKQELLNSSVYKQTSVPERALLVQVLFGGRRREEAADALHELERLADTAGAIVLGRITQRRQKPTSGLFIGEGKLADIQLASRECRANLVIFDNDLSAAQVNNLDLALGIKVIDRTELILQIFARRALSAEAQIQVELAQLEYLVSRIPISEKQQRFQGGIGMKGPGESPFQLRKAPMRRRIKEVKRKLEGIRKRRERTLSRRPWPLACLAGYTNAGKSTLLNAFVRAGAYVDDRLFATLDTKTRLVRLPHGQDILMTDTVGFIRNLPHGLVASFRSTLEVAASADLILVVGDASHPRLANHLEVVSQTLSEIGAGAVRSVLILNKCDQLTTGESLDALRKAYPDAAFVSARHRTGLDSVKQAIANSLPDSVRQADGARQPACGV